MTATEGTTLQPSEPSADPVLDREFSDACAREPISIPGAIQPHGALLVVDAIGDVIKAASRNAAIVVGRPEHAEALLGQPLQALLGADWVADLHVKHRAGALRGAAPWITALALPGQPPLTATVHYHDSRLIIEIEFAAPEDANEALVAAQQLQAALADLRAAGRALPALAVAAAVRRITGYERVLIYRFGSQWDGQAIAEDKVADWDSSLAGLRFPASDIPAQARALYRLNPLRWTPSRDAVPVPLLQDAADARPVDLTFARLRAMSRVHMEYHRNMGVDGAMSLSILHEDQLWGLVVCHHRRPHAASPGQRAAAAVLTDALALRLGAAEQTDTEQARQHDTQNLADLLSQMAGANEVIEALTAGSPNIRALFGASGAAVLYGGAVALLGRTPTAPQVQGLGDWLRSRSDRSKLFQTDNLDTDYPAETFEADTASGLLAAFLSEDKADMLLWFRPEQPELISWGGNPHKPEGKDLTPRSSFEPWIEMRHGVSRPWTGWELKIAESLRHGVTDIILRSLRRIAALDEQLRQSQKMEAVGQLTGGLAHDFNNLMTGIIGSLDLIRLRAGPDQLEGIHQFLDNARIAADRAVSLTNRLLAFSRRQTLDPKPLDVTRLIPALEDLIRRSVGPGVTVDTALPDGLWNTICDANQLDNALLNLALNGRDAMPDGGRLTIEAANVTLDDTYAGRHHELPAGDYVAISVTDTGAGMTPEVLSRVFEPFFTTKPLGQGTGLGLSMVYGFAKQSNGYTGIYSEPGRGTTVRIYLPRYEGEALPDLPNNEAPTAAGAAGETVLLVDDEPVVRMLISEILGEAGYRVLEAADGAAGLIVLRSAQKIDLLLTDVGLPGGLNGRQLADAARVRRPHLKVLFITGYAENAALGNGLLEPGMQVMTKPFSMDVLTSRIRAMF